AFCVVIKLVRNHDVEGRNVLLHASDRTNGNQPLNSQFFEAVNICAVIDFGWQDPVAASMSCEECDFLAVEVADDKCIRWIPERSRYPHFFHIGKLVHLIEAASADHTNLN